MGFQSAIHEINKPDLLHIDYMPRIQIRWNFDFNLNEENVTCLISSGNWLHNNYNNNNFIWSIKTWKYIMHSEGPQLKHHIHNTIKQINGCP